MYSHLPKKEAPHATQPTQSQQADDFIYEDEREPITFGEIQVKESDTRKPRAWFDDPGLMSSEEEVREAAIITLNQTMPSLEELAPTLTQPGKEHLLALAAPIYDEIKCIIVDMRQKRRSASYKDLVSALNVLFDKVMILSGQATQRVEVTLPDDKRNRILSVLSDIHDSPISQPRVIDLEEEEDDYDEVTSKLYEKSI